MDLGDKEGDNRRYIYILESNLDPTKLSGIAPNGKTEHCHVLACNVISFSNKLRFLDQGCKNGIVCYGY
jgi:hypothetical protein